MNARVQVVAAVTVNQGLVHRHADVHSPDQVLVSAGGFPFPEHPREFSVVFGVSRVAPQPGSVSSIFSNGIHGYTVKNSFFFFRFAVGKQIKYNSKLLLVTVLL